MPGKTTTRLRVAGVVFLTVLLSACAGGGEAQNGGDAEAGGAAAAEPIRLGYSAWPGWFPWQVAEEQGLFDAAGVEVELTYFESYTDSLNALATGNLEANSQTLNDTIASVAAGSAQTIVLVNDNSTGNDQIIAAPEIAEVADLAGKRVGAELGTVDHFLLLLGLDRAGLSPDDIDFQPLETGAAAAAFTSGQLDAVGAFAPFTTTALQREGAKVLFSSADFPGAIPDHLVVSRELLAQRPEDVQRLVDAWFATLEFIAANSEEATAIMAERAGVDVEEYRGYEAGTDIFDVADNLEAFSDGEDFTSLRFAAERINEFLLSSDLTDAEAELDGLFDDRFVRAVAGG